MKIQRKRLGEMLIDQGLITEPQLMQILSDQKTSGMKLGQFIVHKGILKEPQIVEVISQQLKIDKYSPDRYPYDVNMDSVVPSEFSQKHNLVPLNKRGNLITVCMTDPMDINALDSLEILTNSEAMPVICTEKELKEITFAIYGVSSDLDEVMDGMDEVSMEGEGPEEEADIAVNSLQDMAEEAPVVRLVNSILSQAVREGASDVHLSPEKRNVQLRFRVDGKLREVPAPPKSVFLPIVSRIKILANMDIAVSRVPQDGRFSFNMDNREVHVRASSLPTIYGENLVLRLLYRSGEGLSLDELGFNTKDLAGIENVIHKPYGMILTTGPTGSGKTTSLYAILRRINNPDVNIITLEDPVEYRIGKIRQVQLNRKAGMTFASGLRSILRQDPDTIMVGEIRDAETASISVQSAMTGHKVLSTLHTNDAAGAVTRLVEMGLEPFLIASTLLVVVAQRLLRKNCPHCTAPYTPPKEAVAAMGLDRYPDIVFKHGTGCHLCNNSGFSGRIGIYEVMFMDDQVKDMILRRASSHELTRTLVQAGKLRTLKHDAALKVAQGITSLEEAASGVLV